MELVPTTDRKTSAPPPRSKEMEMSSPILPAKDMDEWRQRSALLYGDDVLAKFAGTKILIVGLGGVGSAAAEMLCRAGIGRMSLVDGDRIESSNRNRQIIALKSVEGELKTKVLAARLRDINPEISLSEHPIFIRDELTDKILDSDSFDFVVDAIDSLTPKTNLIAKSLSRGLRIVSSMGSGGKTDLSMIRVADIEESFNCRLARMLRKRLHRMGVRGGFKVVFSSEQSGKESILTPEDGGRSIVGTVSYMPFVFGAHCAAEVLRSVAGDAVFATETTST